MKDFIIVHDFDGNRTLINTHNISHIVPYSPTDRASKYFPFDDDENKPWCEI